MQRVCQMAIEIVDFGCFHLLRNHKRPIDIELRIGRTLLQVSKQRTDLANTSTIRKMWSEQPFGQAKLQKSGVLLLLHAHVEP